MSCKKSKQITTADSTRIDGAIKSITVLANLTGTVTVNDGESTEVFVLPIGLTPRTYEIEHYADNKYFTVVTSEADNIVITHST